MEDRLERTALVFHLKTDKESIKTLVFQTAAITTQCTKDDIKIVDCILTFGGVRTVIADVKTLKMRKNIDSVTLFNRQCIAVNDRDFGIFLQAMKELHIAVRIFRED